MKSRIKFIGGFLMVAIISMVAIYSTSYENQEEDAEIIAEPSTDNTLKVKVSPIFGPAVSKDGFLLANQEPEIKPIFNEVPVLENKENPQQLVSVKLYSPDSSVKFALADLQTIPADEQYNIRYFSLYNIPKEKRAEYAKILSFLCNSLGTRKKMYIPVFVGNSDETVVRINLDHYEWDGFIWDEFCENGSGPRPQPEPYFHLLKFKIEPKIERKKVKKKILVDERVEIGKDEQGKSKFEIKRIQKEQEVEEDVVVDQNKTRFFEKAPWLDQQVIDSLMDLAYSTSPIVRADWFIANASLPPAYYDFLRVGKKKADYEKLIFSNEVLAKEARGQDKAVVVTSIVARNNRTLIRSPTFTNGYYWVSHDTLNSVDERQYVQNILDEQFDATEDIGSLPNGLQAYFLADKAGNRLDKADPDFAIDNTAIDRVVRNGRSCIICHAVGIRSIDDEVRNLTKKLQNKAQVALLIARKDDQYRIDDLFSSNLDEQIVKDQNFYRAAIARVNGLTPEVNARIFAEIYDNYAEKLLTKELVSRELGLPLYELEAYLKLSRDNVSLGLVRDPIRAVRRDQWERSFQVLMSIIGEKEKKADLPIVPPME
jgi:hypothetical protein